MDKILIFGASVGGREVFNIIQQLNKDTPTWEVLGFVDSDPSLIGKDIDGYPIYDTDHSVSSKGVYAICCVMNPERRKIVIQNEIEIQGFEMASIISPEGNRPKDLEVGPGSVIYPGVNISYGVRLGKSNFIFFNVMIGHDLHAGDFVTVLPGVTINGDVTIGEECLIGSGSTLHPGISIGKNSIVGIGTTLFEGIGEKKSAMALPRIMMKDL
jgi:sugar O-acyltransferase (sialic acid O-acetyltransferase NeuD family)